MNQLLSAILLLIMAVCAADAHFVFVVPEPGGASAKVFISETLTPDKGVGLSMISGAQLTIRNAAGNETALSLVNAGDFYTVALPGSGARTVHGLADLGLSQNGSTKPYLLVYHPKTILGDAFDPKSAVGASAPVEVVPVGKPGALKLQLLAHGKPQPNVEITAILPDGTQKKLRTDSEGQTETLTQTGRYGAWARYWEPGSGERDGKKYDEVRHYATLVFNAPEKTTASDGITATRFATLPEATASFGSVVSDGWLYIYGGHVSKTHAYSTEAVSGRFYRVNLSGTPAWEELPGGEHMQGMNLAAYQGKIYLVGGMSPRNKPGTPADNHSVAACSRFDPATKRWESLPPLPQPRSSHDVVLIGSKLIVIGGWTLKGAGTEWMESIAVLDLAAPAPEWKTEQQPFKRRALMAAAYEGKVYVIGGFDDKNEVVRDVSIYDPAANSWSNGTKLPKGPGLSFAPAAGVHNGDLYVSVSDGTLYHLARSSQEWEKVGKSTPRLAHRIASADRAVLVIGGAANGNNSDLIEAVPVSR
jgi:N-acetylneuraminic acid mutarotase/uncharacterized GH25 family protein